MWLLAECGPNSKRLQQVLGLPFDPPPPPPPQCGSLGFYVPISHQDPSGLLASEVVRFSGLMNSTVNAAAPIWGSLFSSPSSLYPPPLSSCSDSLLVILRSYPQLGARGNHVVLC